MNQQEIKISVIVPCYNVEKYVEKCIKSICGQKYQNLEIILINDGSKDKTEKICRHYEKEDSRIKFLTVSNGGVSKARNIGLRIASGKYVTFVDGDDYLETEHIEKLAAGMKKGINLSMCNYYEVYENHIQEHNITCKTGTLEPTYVCAHLCGSDTYGGQAWTKLFDLEIIREHNLLFDENIKICEDALFIVSYLTLMQGKVFYNNLATYAYIQREGSALHLPLFINQITKLLAFEKCIELIEKSMPEVVLIYQKNLLFTTYYFKSKFILEKADETQYKEIVERIIAQNYKSVYEKCSLKEKIKLYIYCKHMEKVVLLRKLLRR